MRRRRIVLVAALAVLAVGVITWYAARVCSPEYGNETRELRSIGATLFSVDAPEITRRGPPRITILRLNRAADLVPHHFQSDGFATPQTIENWIEHLGAPVVFNAGQFDENLSHLGWLKADGNWLTAQKHRKWMGLLVSGPIQGPPWAGVIDLQAASDKVVEHYRFVVQSMMLIDDQANVRVRDTDRSACRTVAAQDREGRLLIIVTEGATTLADLAGWLSRSHFGIVRAMNLDGGIETQLAIRTPELERTFYGQYGTGTTMFDAGAGPIKYPLPAVVAVVPQIPPPTAAPKPKG